MKVENENKNNYDTKTKQHEEIQICVIRCINEKCANASNIQQMKHDNDKDKTTVKCATLIGINFAVQLDIDFIMTMTLLKQNNMRRYRYV
jgi:hypothetical protein